jgi:LysM domain-containing protein
MSNTVATRTRRFTPPSAPTRKPTPGRRVTGHGASVVGRADRPVLRIVADDERAPVLTHHLPAAEPVETTRVRLDDFFAAEYDGDDVALEVVGRRSSTIRLTRRGRLVVLVAGLAAALGLGLFGASLAVAGDHPEQTRVVTVHPGQTLWDIASSAAARTGAGDTRSMMSHLQALNHLDSTTLQVGQHLRVPVAAG